MKYSPDNQQNKAIILPKFDPQPSGELSEKILKETNVKGVLIGRLAVWAWVEDAAKHGFTKDIDIAITQQDQKNLVSYLVDRGFKVRELSIGGFNISDDQIQIDFIHRNSKEWGDLSSLFEEAIEQSTDIKVAIGHAELLLIPVEYLIAMKIGTTETKDENDARLLIESVDSVKIKELRKIVHAHLGPMGKSKLENLLREVGHADAISRKIYGDNNELSYP